MSKFVLLLDHDGTLVLPAQLPKLNEDMIDSALNQHRPPSKDLQHVTNSSLIEANEDLLSKLTDDLHRHDKAPFDNIIVGSGSKRQNWFCDTSNSIKNKTYSSSSFKLLTFVTAYLKAKFPSVILDKFLTSDHYAQQKDGTIFEAALKWLDGEPYSDDHVLFKDCPIDNSKISMIFAWVQRIGLQGGGVVRFVDDELQKDEHGEIFIHPTVPVVLSALIPFFKKYPQLIPNNVTLEIIHCTNREPKLETSILGTGTAHLNYLKMMEQMMLASITDSEERRNFMNSRTASCNCFELFNNPAFIDILLERSRIDEQKSRDIPSSTNNGFFHGIDIHILGGFIAVCGVVAITVAFVVLNAATLGISGLVVAAIGAASLLIGVGLFATAPSHEIQTQQFDEPRKSC